MPQTGVHQAKVNRELKASKKRGAKGVAKRPRSILRSMPSKGGSAITEEQFKASCGAKAGQELLDGFEKKVCNDTVFYESPFGACCCEEGGEEEGEEGGKDKCCEKYHEKNRTPRVTILNMVLHQSYNPNRRSCYG